MKFHVVILSILTLIALFKTSTSSVLAQGTPWTVGVGQCVQNLPVAGGGTVDVPTIQGFECLFANILKVIVTVAGLAFLVMFVVGGFQYMQTNNDPKAVAGAASTLTYAVIGLVGIIISWLILLFIENFTGAKVTEFKIPV